MIVRHTRLVAAGVWSATGPAFSSSCHRCRTLHSSHRSERTQNTSVTSKPHPSNTTQQKARGAKSSASKQQQPRSAQDPALEKEFLSEFLDIRERHCGPVSTNRSYEHPRIRAIPYAYNTKVAEQKAFEALARALYPLAVEEEVRPTVANEPSNLLDKIPIVGSVRQKHTEFAAIRNWAYSRDWLLNTPVGARVKELEALLGEAQAENPQDADKIQEYQALYSALIWPYAIDHNTFYQAAVHMDQGFQLEPEHCYRILGADYEVKHEKILYPVWDVTGGIIVPCTGKRLDNDNNITGVQSTEAYFRFKRGMVPAHVSAEKPWLSYIPLCLPQPPFDTKKRRPVDNPAYLAIPAADARLPGPEAAYDPQWPSLRLPFSLSPQSVWEAWAKKLKTLTVDRPVRRVSLHERAGVPAPMTKGLRQHGVDSYLLDAGEYTFQLEDAKFEYISSSPLVLPLYVSTFKHRKHGTGEKCTTVVVQSAWDGELLRPRRRERYRVSRLTTYDIPPSRL